MSKEPDWLGLWREMSGMREGAQLTTEKSNDSKKIEIENYLIVPSELWDALPDKQKAKVPEGLAITVRKFDFPIKISGCSMVFCGQ